MLRLQMKNLVAQTPCLGMRIKKMKKILYLVTQAETGGAQKYVADLAINLNKSQFGAIVAAGGNQTDPLFLNLQKNQVKYYCLKYVIRAINPIYDFLGFWEIFNLIKKEKPDVVHLNSSKVEILGSIATKLLGIKKIIFTAHGYVFNEPMADLKRKFYIFLEKFSSKFIDKIICVSEFDKQTGLKNKIAPENKYVIIHNAINLNNYNFLDNQEARQKLQEITKIDFQDKKIIGTIANLYKTKGLEYFIDAAKIVNRGDVIYMVIGEGDERNNLKLRIKDSELTNFFLVGNIPEAANYLKGFDIFVLPSVKEGFPYTVLEAMAANVPVITTGVGALPEIIKNNENGILIEPKNPQILADKIKLLLSDQGLYQKIENNTNINQDNFNEFLQQTTELY